MRASAEQRANEEARSELARQRAELARLRGRAPSGHDAFEALFRYLSAVADLPPATLARAVGQAAPNAEGLMATVAEQWMAQGEARGLAKGEAKGKAEGEAKGKAEGKAQSVLDVLEARGLSVTAAQRAKVLGCTDLATLKGWVRQAVTVKAAAELFAAPKRTTKARR